MWEYRAACLHVIDGDTIRVLADTGFGSRHEIDVRLLGVSAPELGQPGGAEASAFTVRWVDQLDQGLRWPIHIWTQVNTNPEPDERRSFVRYLANVTDMRRPGRNLNVDLADYLNQHPEWGTGT